MRIPDLSLSVSGPPEDPDAGEAYLSDLDDSPPSPFLQFNCNGLRHCGSELAHYLKENRVAVAALQETKMTPSSRPVTDFPEHAVIRRDRPAGDGGGGLAFLVHHSLQYTIICTDHLFPANSPLELQGITLHLDNLHLQLFNIYIPPATSCPPSFSPDLHPIFDFCSSDALIVGDFNPQPTLVLPH